MLTEVTGAAMRVSDCLPQPPAPTGRAEEPRGVSGRAEEPRGVSTSGVPMSGVSVSGDFTSAKPVGMPWRGWR